MTNKIARITAQQGDVIMVKLNKMPEGTITKRTKKKMILAHGESGHSHVVEDDEAELIEMGERMLLTLTKPTVVHHEEHKPITLEPGIWDIGKVMEYDYFLQMKRPVMD